MSSRSAHRTTTTAITTCCLLAFLCALRAVGCFVVDWLQARGVADEILPPAFLNDAYLNSLAEDIVEQAKVGGSPAAEGGGAGAWAYQGCTLHAVGTRSSPCATC